MRLASHDLARLVFAFSLLGSTAGCVDRGEPEATEPGALRRRFPDAAAEVLQARDVFVIEEGGFTVPGRATVRAGLLAHLPERGDGAMRFEVPGGFSVQVREVGARGDAMLEERAVTYPRAGGASYWAAVEGGYEEWLLLDAGVATGDHAVATWEIEGGTARQAGEYVEIAGVDGVARIRVGASRAYAEGGRLITPRLEARGSAIDLWVDSGGAPVLVDPSWTSAAQLGYARYAHTATPYGNGSKILVVGGFNDVNAVSNNEIYDVATGMWTFAAKMTTTRYNHSATLLPSGKLMFAGGQNGLSHYASVEIYDPATNKFTAGASMVAARNRHTATLLGNGKVLVVGGVAGATVASAELYDPAANTWSSAGTLAQGRYAHTATTLPDGKVLVAGGNGGVAALASAEIYDPATNMWMPAASMSDARMLHTATLLPSGQVLVVAGSSGAVAPLAGAELYDPATNTWTATAAINPPRSWHSATLLGSNVLVAGGRNGLNSTASSAVFDPSSGMWKPGPALVAARHWHTSTLLPDGKVLVTGGYTNATVLATVELYGPSPLAAACVVGADCASGFCADGVCCDAACTGACDACTVAAGAAKDGTCVPVTGTSCDDGNACTQTDTCQSGTCVGGNPVVCMAVDACHDVGVCNPASGQCSNPAKADGTACNDGSACTQSDTCQAGACTGTMPVVCAAKDQCHDAGTCDPASGQCSNPAKMNGAPCNDGNACTQSDTCQAGACAGASPVMCAAKDECHEAGACDPASGACSEPVKMDGAPCAGGACASGACVPSGTGGGGMGGMGGATSGSGGDTTSSGTGGDTTGAGAGGSGGMGGATTGSGGSGGSTSATGGGDTTSGTTTGATGGTGGGTTSGGGPNEGEGESGCSCGVSGTPTAGGAWVALGLVLAVRRRRSSAQRAASEAGSTR